ncbi:MAG: beta-galactosidase trimerization domain-containing protein, partial [Nitrososphaerota archaeon]|nr:beta-galactosidase trimerization domain-containing protein [Nitrososphaerota archaeon]
EWVRFRSVSFERYLALQVNAVKNVSPGKFVTTNRMQLSSFVEVDSFELGRFMDFVSLDLYPKGRSDRTDPAWNAMQFAVARGSSKSGSFYVTELQAGQTDGHTVPSPEGVHTTMIGLLPEQGEMRDWFYQAVAHGSRANLFFNWRTNTRGKEQYWHGVLGHDGEPNDRYREMQKIGRELGPLSGAVLGSRLQSSVAVIMSFDSLWASDVIESGYHPVSYMQQLFASYRGLWNAGVVPQVIGPDADLKQFSLVVAPFMYLFDRRLASKIKSYVASGGFIVCTARSFVKDEYNRVMAESPPGILTNVLGFNLGRYSRLPLGEKETTIRVSRNPLTGSRSQIKCSGWIEELSPVKGAATMGVHDHPLLKGAPAMILHRYGKGRALTVGGFPDSDFYSMLGLKVNDGRRMEFRGGTGVEVVERTNGGRTTVFVMNHGSTERRLSYAAKGRVREVLSGTECGAEGKIVLPPHDVRLFHVDD